MQLGGVRMQLEGASLVRVRRIRHTDGVGQPPETVDGRTFLYTEDAVYQTPLRLYELEDRLEGTEFVRASKQLLATFDHVKAIRPAINARLQLLLDNGEAVIVSRQYAPSIKRKLGL